MKKEYGGWPYDVAVVLKTFPYKHFVILCNYICFPMPNSNPVISASTMNIYIYIVNYSNIHIQVNGKNLRVVGTWIYCRRQIESVYAMRGEGKEGKR